MLEESDVSKGAFRPLALSLGLVLIACSSTLPAAPTRSSAPVTTASTISTPTVTPSVSPRGSVNPYQVALLGPIQRIELYANFLAQDIGQSKDTSPDLRYLQEAVVDGRVWLASNALPACLESFKPGLASLLDQADQAVASLSPSSVSASDQVTALSTAALSLATALEARPC
jgi:hypothetical protein